MWVRIPSVTPWCREGASEPGWLWTSLRPAQYWYDTLFRCSLKIMENENKTESAPFTGEFVTAGTSRIMVDISTGTDPSKRDDLQIARAYQEGTNKIRSMVSQSVKRLLQTAGKTGFSKEDFNKGGQSIRAYANALRNAAVFVDSLHELAREDIQFSKDVGAVMGVLGELLETSCGNMRAFGAVSKEIVTKTVKSCDSLAAAIEKTEEVVSLAADLEQIEVGVHNLGIPPDEFRRLAGVDGSAKSSVLSEEEVQRILPVSYRANPAVPPNAPPVPAADPFDWGTVEFESSDKSS